MKRSTVLTMTFGFAAVCFAQTLQAATPSLTVASATGAAGSTVQVPVSFDPGSSSIASLQMSVVLPAALSAGALTPGPALTAASKSITSAVSGQTYILLIYGMNQTPIGAGILLTMPLTIAGGTSAGTLSVPLSGVIYSDPNGNNVTPGTLTDGTITIPGAAGKPMLQLSKSVDRTTVQSAGTITYTISYQNSGTADALNVVLTDALPTGATLVAGSLQPAGTVSGGVIRWTIGTVVAGAPAGQVKFQVTAN